VDILKKTTEFLRWSEKWTKTDMVYLTKNGSWLTLAQIVSGASSFLLAVAFANLLPKEDYGIYKYVLSVAALLTIPTLTEMHSAVIQAVARGYEGAVVRAFKTKLKWGSFSTLAAIILSAYYWNKGNDVLVVSFLCAGAFLPLSEAANLFSAFFSGRKNFRAASLYNNFVQIGLTGLMIASLYLLDKVLYVIIAYFSAYALLRLLAYRRAIKKYRPNRDEDGDTIAYGKHLSLISVFGFLSSNLDKILLWHFLGAAPLAIYSFALAPVNQISQLLKSIIPLAFPKFAAQDSAIIKKTLPAKALKFFFVILLGVLAYIWLAPYLFRIFFPQYLEAVNYSRLWSLVLLFFPQKLIGAALQAKKQTKILYIISITNSIIKITFLVILLPLFGIVGAIISMLIPYLINTILQLFYLKRI